MFIGHYAAGLAARHLSHSLSRHPNHRQGNLPRGGPSLGTFFMAAQWVDLVWPMLVLLGVEKVAIAPGITAITPLDFQHYPYTHSLLAALLWGAGFATVYRIVRKDTSGALWLGAAVVSHWVLDWISHRPDLPLAPGLDTRVGLGLWNAPVAAVIVEVALFAAAGWAYLRATRALDNTGRYAMWGLAAFLGVAYLANLLGPPPPSDTALAVSALALWLLVPWAYWIDRHRE